jgi:hypothetical protein
VKAPDQTPPPRVVHIRRGKVAKELNIYTATIIGFYQCMRCFNVQTVVLPERCEKCGKLQPKYFPPVL